MFCDIFSSSSSFCLLILTPGKQKNCQEVLKQLSVFVSLCWVEKYDGCSVFLDC